MKVALVHVPKEIHPDVLEWLTDGWNRNPKDAIPFLKHLIALRHGAASRADSLIVVERGTVLAPNFEEKINAIIPKIPPQYTTCLLTHYVTSWTGISHIGGTDKQFCTVNENVLESSAYWLNMNHAEHLLAMFDQPLRFIPSFDLTPEKLSRCGHVCMLSTPLVARLDEKRFQDYYANYGFVTSQ